MNQPMRENDQAGWAFVGALLASLQINLYVGFPLYVLAAAGFEDITLIPDRPTEIALLVACLLPVFLFFLWTVMTAPRDPSAVAARELKSPEIQAELENLARVMGSELAELEGAEREFRRATEARMEALALAEAEYAAKLAGATPEEAATVVRNETEDHVLANRVSQRLWEDNLKSLSNEAFASLAAETEATLNPRRLDYLGKMLALDVEREQRDMPLGDPLIDLSEADIEADPAWTDQQTRFMAASRLRWQANSRVASGGITDAEILYLKRAEAEAARASRVIDTAR